jgi:hypothetical protein
MLALIIGIPCASIVFGVVMFYFAFTSADRDVLQDAAPLSKTSWRQQPSETEE